MVLVHCEACTTAYPPDAARCPHCGSTERHEAGAGPASCPHCGNKDDDMAKISRAGGPSFDGAAHDDEDAEEARLQDEAGEAADAELVDDDAVVVTANAEPAAATATGITPIDDIDDSGSLRPAGNASKAEWWDCAYAVGADVEGTSPDDYTRDELIALVDRAEAINGGG